MFSEPQQDQANLPSRPAMMGTIAFACLLFFFLLFARIACCTRCSAITLPRPELCTASPSSSTLMYLPRCHRQASDGLLLGRNSIAQRRQVFSRTRRVPRGTR